MGERMRKYRPSVDHTASLTGAILAISGVLEIPKKLGLSVDDFAIIIGSMGTIAGALRHEFEKRKLAK